MHGVEALGLRLGQLHHAGRDDAQAGLLEAAVDLADQVLLHAVGLHNGKSAFERHGIVVLEAENQSMNQ